jgi:ssDNA-binding replication factor A large subunit
VLAGIVADVTLYTPRGDSNYYMSRTKKQATRKQLAALISKYGSEFVADVQSEPEQLLRIATYPRDKIESIDDVELRDGIQLAVVVDTPITPLDKLVERVAGVEAKVSFVCRSS